MRVAAVVLVGSLAVAACATSNDEGAPTTQIEQREPAQTLPSPPSTVDSQPPGIALAATPGVERSPVAAEAAIGPLAGGLNDAGFNLLRTLPRDENVVFSPASIGHALLMASAAGDDTTRRAIETALALPDDAHSAWNAIDQAIAAAQSEQVTVTIADRIWPRIGIEPEQDWVDLLATEHGADVVPLDFAGATDESREIINTWVEERTDGLIVDLLPPNFLDDNTVLVLTDAIYFAADWATPFGKYGPQPGTFTTLEGDELDVSFMRELELSDRRGAGDGFVGAEIPYVGDDYSMLVLVPDEGEFESFVDRLDAPLLNDIDATFTTGPYELLLPKWDDEYRIDLVAWLREMGASPGSYPGITPEAFLDAAVHAADIAVDERGTVAAAATALGFDASGPADPELTVAADQPFVYLIRHRESGLVLFAGTVVDPS
ncbi:MAG: serpin family protein [Actinomycetota bacterium]